MTTKELKTFFQPDFAFVHWILNLVLRWESIPGPEIFLVWAQDISGSGIINDNLFAGLEKKILNKQPQNIL